MSDDLELVAGITRGEQDAFARLYDRYAPVLMAVGVRVLGSEKEAEDLLHDVFLETWRSIRDYDPERGTVRAWLCLRMRSRALDRVRSAGRSRVVSLEDVGVTETSAGPDDPSAAPDRRVVQAALRELPEEQRKVLELGYFEGLSSSEIASRLSVPIGTVKSRVAAALGKLRTALGVRTGTGGGS